MQNTIYHPQQMHWFVNRCNKNGFIVGGALPGWDSPYIYRLAGPGPSIRRDIKKSAALSLSTKEEVEEFADTECAIARMVG